MGTRLRVLFRYFLGRFFAQPLDQQHWWRLFCFDNGVTISVKIGVKMVRFHTSIWRNLSNFLNLKLLDAANLTKEGYCTFRPVVLWFMVAKERFCWALGCFTSLPLGRNIMQVSGVWVIRSLNLGPAVSCEGYFWKMYGAVCTKCCEFLGFKPHSAYWMSG